MVQDIGSTAKDLIKALSSYNDLSRVEARKALVAMGNQAIPYLAEALKDSHPVRRWQAAKTLGEIGDPKAAPMLVKALEDEKFEVRWLAAKGLIEMNVKSLKPLFEALIKNADSALLRQGAHHVLHDLAKGELRIHLAPVLIALECMDCPVQVPPVASHALNDLTKAGII
jgi:HEAT repeat protein